MPDLFKKLFGSSSSTKGSTSANPTSSTTPQASSSHTRDSTLNLDLVAGPIVEAYQLGLQSERKQRCIARGITALELLKEISEANDILAPLKAICGVTLAILNTIEVGLFNRVLFCYSGILIDEFRPWIATRKRGRRSWIPFINIVACLNNSSTQRIWSK